MFSTFCKASLSRLSLGLLFGFIWPVLLPTLFPQVNAGHAQAATSAQILPYDVGLAKAKAEGKWVMVKFEREDCLYCGQMTRETQANPRTLQLLNQNFIWVQVDQKGQRKVWHGKQQITEAELSQRLKAWNYPYLLFLKPDGTEIGGLLGYQSPENMQHLLRYIASGAYERMRFEQFKQRR